MKSIFLTTRFAANSTYVASQGRALVTLSLRFRGISELPTDSAASLCLAAHCFGLQPVSLLVCSLPCLLSLPICRSAKEEALKSHTGSYLLANKGSSQNQSVIKSYNRLIDLSDLALKQELQLKRRERSLTSNAALFLLLSAFVCMTMAGWIPPETANI